MLMISSMNNSIEAAGKTQSGCPGDAVKQRGPQKAEGKFRLIFQTAADAMLLWELRSGKTPVLAEANLLAAQRLGYPPEAMTGLAFADIFPSPPAELTAVIEQPSDGQFGVLESAFRTKSGLNEPVEISYSTFNIDGRRFMLSIARDISARKAEASTLTEAYNREKSLRQALETEISKRVDFTRSLVHELKTPLTPLIASGEALLEILEGEDELRLAGNIYRGAMNLERRINDLLDFARGEMGVLKVRAQPLDVAPLLLDLAAQVSPQFDRKNQSLELEIDDDIPLVMADEDRLRQILLNLLNNAGKFTPRGGQITIGAAVSGKMLRLSVADTGRGMTLQEQAHIFKPYYRIVDDADPNDGMGIGLALCKMLVTLQGGDIWFESEKDCGTTFYFTLPLTAEME
ncbi:PAS domain S-box [Dehalogenimonas alkenigignens]|uniref:histidine kinase n=2 Tax=Dehalogenimonas alkenigignens TaxID=1217799 RepID=A0A0W0GIL8_9CHLR|nr:PAS domain S-box [Dehalogenimonas alkenigignens]